jgi:hypothetical protein
MFVSKSTSIGFSTPRTWTHQFTMPQVKEEEDYHKAKHHVSNQGFVWMNLQVWLMYQSLKIKTKEAHLNQSSRTAMQKNQWRKNNNPSLMSWDELIRSVTRHDANPGQHLLHNTTLLKTAQTPASIQL